MAFKIGVVTSYPPELSGLADYSKYLYTNISSITQNLKIIIYAHRPPSITKPTTNQIKKNLTVKFSWNHKSIIYPFKVFKQAVKDNVKLLHVHHEYWLYGRGLKSTHLLLLLLLLKISNKKIIITLHGLTPLKTLTNNFKKFHKTKLSITLFKLFAFTYIKILCALSNAIIIHLNIMKHILTNEYRIPEKKLYVIPHGIPQTKHTQYNEEKTKKTILTFGTIRPDKGIEIIIETFNTISKNIKNLNLIIAGSCNPVTSPESPKYLKKIINKINKMALQDKIKLFINNPWKIIEYLHVKADLVILNYLDENILAASGPLSLAIAHEKPVIATKMPRFLEYRDYMLLIKPNDKEELRKAVEMILLNQKSCKALKRKMKILKQQHNWSSIAKKHINLYLKTVK